jgi:hypothetical protein
MIQREARAKAIAQLRLAEPEILEATRTVVPKDTGSLASTARLEWSDKGFQWVIGDLQGVVKFVDYEEVVDARQNFVQGKVVPAIRFVLIRRSLAKKIGGV